MSGGLQIGLVGCGEWGRHILRDLRSPGAEVEVVARSEESRERARQGGATRIVPALEEMGIVDGVVIATPSSTHAALIHQVLARDVPIFTEKPMTVDPQEADNLAAAAPERLFVMHKWRYHPGVEKLGELARSGDIGDVGLLHCVRVGWGNPHDDVDVFWHLAPHDLSIILEILGELPPAAAAVGGLVDARDGTMIGMLGSKASAVIEISGLRTDRSRQVRLYGSLGTAVLDGPYATSVRVEQQVGDSGVKAVELPISSEFPLLGELRAFVGHLRGGPPPRSSAAESAVLLRRLAELRALAGIPG